MLLTLGTFIPVLHTDLENASMRTNITFSEVATFYQRFNNFYQNCNKVDEDQIPILVKCTLYYIECISNLVNHLDKLTNPQFNAIKQYLSIVSDMPYLEGIKEVFMKLISVQLLEKITNFRIKPYVRKELVKHFNLSLQCIPRDLRSIISENSKIYLCKLANMMCTCGDYDYQSSILETIFRLCTKDLITKFASQFFPKSMAHQNGILQIRTSDFDKDIRVFLNAINIEFKTVFSYKCHRALLGDITILPPPIYSGKSCHYTFLDTSSSDEELMNLLEKRKIPKIRNFEKVVDEYSDEKDSDGILWVDFNMASNSISILCDKDSVTSTQSPQNDEWEIILTNISDVTMAQMSNLIMVDVPGSIGSVIIFNLSNTCTFKYTATTKAAEARILELAILKCPELKQLKEKVLPQLLGDKFEILSTCWVEETKILKKARHPVTNPEELSTKLAANSKREYKPLKVSVVTLPKRSNRPMNACVPEDSNGYMVDKKIVHVVQTHKSVNYEDKVARHMVCDSQYYITKMTVARRNTKILQSEIPVVDNDTACVPVVDAQNEDSLFSDCEDLNLFDVIENTEETEHETNDLAEYNSKPHLEVATEDSTNYSGELYTNTESECIAKDTNIEKLAKCLTFEANTIENQKFEFGDSSISDASNHTNTKHVLIDEQLNKLHEIPDTNMVTRSSNESISEVDFEMFYKLHGDIQLENTRNYNETINDKEMSLDQTNQNEELKSQSNKCDLEESNTSKDNTKLDSPTNTTQKYIGCQNQNANNKKTSLEKIEQNPHNSNKIRRKTSKENNYSQETIANASKESIPNKHTTSDEVTEINKDTSYEFLVQSQTAVQDNSKATPSNHIKISVCVPSLKKIEQNPHNNSNKIRRKTSKENNYSEETIANASNEKVPNNKHTSDEVTQINKDASYEFLVQSQTTVQDNKATSSKHIKISVCAPIKDSVAHEQFLLQGNVSDHSTIEIKHNPEADLDNISILYQNKLMNNNTEIQETSGNDTRKSTDDVDCIKRMPNDESYIPQEINKNYKYKHISKKFKIRKAKLNKPTKHIKKRKERLQKFARLKSITNKKTVSLDNVEILDLNNSSMQTKKSVTSPVQKITLMKVKVSQTKRLKLNDEAVAYGIDVIKECSPEKRVNKVDNAIDTPQKEIIINTVCNKDVTFLDSPIDLEESSTKHELALSQNKSCISDNLSNVTEKNRTARELYSASANTTISGNDNDYATDKLINILSSKKLTESKTQPSLNNRNETPKFRKLYNPNEFLNLVNVLDNDVDFNTSQQIFLLQQTKNDISTQSNKLTEITNITQYSQNNHLNKEDTIRATFKKQLAKNILEKNNQNLSNDNVSKKSRKVPKSTKKTSMKTGKKNIKQTRKVPNKNKVSKNKQENVVSEEDKHLQSIEDEQKHSFKSASQVVNEKDLKRRQKTIRVEDYESEEVPQTTDIGDLHSSKYLMRSKRFEQNLTSKITSDPVGDILPNKKKLQRIPKVKKNQKDCLGNISNNYLVQTTTKDQVDTEHICKCTEDENKQPTTTANDSENLKVDTNEHHSIIPKPQYIDVKQMVIIRNNKLQGKIEVQSVDTEHKPSTVKEITVNQNTLNKTKLIDQLEVENNCMDKRHTSLLIDVNTEVEVFENVTSKQSVNYKEGVTIESSEMSNKTTTPSKLVKVHNDQENLLKKSSQSSDGSTRCDPFDALKEDSRHDTNTTAHSFKVPAPVKLQTKNKSSNVCENKVVNTNNLEESVDKYTGKQTCSRYSDNKYNFDSWLNSLTNSFKASTASDISIESSVRYRNNPTVLNKKSTYTKLLDEETAKQYENIEKGNEHVGNDNNFGKPYDTIENVKVNKIHRKPSEGIKKYRTHRYWTKMMQRFVNITLHQHTETYTVLLEIMKISKSDFVNEYKLVKCLNKKLQISKRNYK